MHHGRGCFSVHEYNILTDSNTRGLDHHTTSDIQTCHDPVFGIGYNTNTLPPPIFRFVIPPLPHNTAYNTSLLPFRYRYRFQYRRPSKAKIWCKYDLKYKFLKPKIWKFFTCGGPSPGSRLKWRAVSGEKITVNFQKIKSPNPLSRISTIPPPAIPFAICNTPPEIPVPTTGWQVCRHWHRNKQMLTQDCF